MRLLRRVVVILLLLRVLRLRVLLLMRRCALLLHVMLLRAICLILLLLPIHLLLMTRRLHAAAVGGLRLLRGGRTVCGGADAMTQFKVFSQQITRFVHFSATAMHKTTQQITSVER